MPSTIKSAAPHFLLPMFYFYFLPIKIKYQTSQALATCLWARSVLSHKTSMPSRILHGNFFFFYFFFQNIFSIWRVTLSFSPFFLIFIFIFVIYSLSLSLLLLPLLCSHILPLFSSPSPSGVPWFSRKIIIFRESSHLYCSIENSQIGVSENWRYSLFSILCVCELGTRRTHFGFSSWRVFDICNWLIWFEHWLLFFYFGKKKKLSCLILVIQRTCNRRLWIMLCDLLYFQKNSLYCWCGLIGDSCCCCWLLGLVSAEVLGVFWGRADSHFVPMEMQV